MITYKPKNRNTPQEVCAVMCTYGRFEIVRQSITMFLAQDYPNKKMVIFNTSEVPLKLAPILADRPDIKVVNQSTKSNGEPFTCLGDVRNASLEHATGDIYICWDDDDLFMPWHISQCMDRYMQIGELAWKPNVSYWSHTGGESFKGLMGNSMEASFVVDMEQVKKIGFSTNRSGAEHVDGGWLSQTNFVEEDISPFESYGYIWGDERAPHKTSGNIGDDNNFENHKKSSADLGEGKLLTPAPLNIMDKFFESALDMWANQQDREMAGHSANASDIKRLRGMMREFYYRFLLPLPEFLQPEDSDEQSLQNELEDLMKKVVELQQKLNG